MVLRSICVFCGARPGHDPAHAAAAVTLGRTLAEQGIRLVYGGGAVGLMGIVADAALAAGGEVIGVIPEAMVDRQVANEACTHLHVVATMHERTALFTELADAFLTLPGGVGTMDELWEAISWAQLGYHSKPVGLLNAFGFYDGLLGFVRHITDTGFVRPAHARILIAEHELDLLLERMEAYEPHQPIFRMKASDL